MTALYPHIVYGPVRSRRLGLSLGINLLPLNAKLCTFDCIYCECGWNSERRGDNQLYSPQQVAEALEAVLTDMAAQGELPDVITFAGNGEPTLHPEFEKIIEWTITLRDALAPKTKISVLSNATQLHREDVVRALKRVDNNILKLDSLFDDVVAAINKPCCHYSVQRVVEQIKLFGNQATIQTMFLRGECDGKIIDNTTPEQIAAWLEAIKEIAPKAVMVYSIARDTPCQTLQKVEKEELEAIAEKVRALGIECSVA